MIILKSLLTAFEASIIWGEAGAVGKIVLSLKRNHNNQD